MLKQNGLLAFRSKLSQQFLQCNDECTTLFPDKFLIERYFLNRTIYKLLQRQLIHSHGLRWTGSFLLMRIRCVQFQAGTENNFWCAPIYCLHKPENAEKLGSLRKLFFRCHALIYHFNNKWFTLASKITKFKDLWYQKFLLLPNASKFALRYFKSKKSFRTASKLTVQF